MMVISCIFIIFILLIFTIIIFYTRTNKTYKESFTTQISTPTPTAVNIPAGSPIQQGNPFFVGNRYPMIPEEPIVEPSGRYEFKKMKLLYDGVWGEKCYLDGRGLEKCDWDDKNRQFGKYGTDHFFDLPEKKLEEGEVVISPPECRKSGYKKQKDYFYLEKPTFEDVFGFVPQSNRLEIDLPPPILATF
jgi:hypothetical protein